MEPYLKEELQKFDVKHPTKSQNSPHPQVLPKFESKTQYTEVDNSLPATKPVKSHIKQVNGKCLWCTRAVDSMLLTVLSALTSQQ